MLNFVILCLSMFLIPGLLYFSLDLRNNHYTVNLKKQKVMPIFFLSMTFHGCNRTDAHAHEFAPFPYVSISCLMIKSSLTNSKHVRIYFLIVYSCLSQVPAIDLNQVDRAYFCSH